MQIACPGCKAHYSFDENRIAEVGVKLRCSKCRTIFRVVKKPRQSAESAAQSPTTGSSRIKVMVANESLAFCSAVCKVLANEPFDVSTYHDGRDTLTAIEAERPAVVLLDVALPSVYGFDICEEVRKNPSLDGVKLILVASIYDKTKYKRTPESLYGADAYIEKHHIPDALAAMIYRLIGGETAAGKQLPEPQPVPASDGEADPEQLAVDAEQESARRSMQRDEERGTTNPPTVGGGGEHSDDQIKARRLARIIVSDILLYNQGKVEEGIRNGTFYELLKDDINEGRALYARRVGPEIAVSRAYLDEAFDQLIANKRQEMNL